MKNLLTITLLLGSLATFSQTLSLEAGTTRAVVVGIADYQDDEIPDLRFSDKDAQAFVEYLQSPAGGSVSDEHMIVLMNEKATNARIADALIWLLEESKKGDKAIIYFSGHGDVETITRFNRGYLLTYDSPPKIYMAGALNIRDLQDIISTLSDNEVQVVMISDACRAGKLAGSEVGGTEATAQNLSKQFANEVKILSCQPNEFSLEGEQWGGGRGAFSYHLLDGLYGLADKSGDGQVNLFEIGRYLEDLVPQETAPHAQMPFTVGDRNTRLAIVDQISLEQLEEKKSTEQSTLSMIETKGMEEILLAKVDSNIQKMYDDFLVALENKQLLEPAETCAFDLYQKLSQEASIQDLHNIMRRNLSVALQEDAQQAVNAYLAANPTEIQRRYESEENYYLYPRYLEKAAELLGEKHFYYEKLMAKKYYFEGLQIRLDADNKVDSASYQKAIEKQMKALEYQDRAPFILNELGVLHTRLKNSEKAVEYYEKAIEITPGWGLPYINLCLEYYYNNDGEKAAAMGDKAIEVMPDYPQLYNLLGWIHADFWDYRDKSNWTRNGVELKEDFTYQFKGTTTLSERKGDLKKSIELLQKAIELDTTYAAAHGNVGVLFHQVNSAKEAEYHLKKATQYDPDNDYYYAWLGITLHSLQTKYEESESALKKAIELVPEDSKQRKGWYNNDMGNMYRRWPKPEKAIAAYERALDIIPDYGSVFASLGYLYRTLGEFMESEKYYLKYRQASSVYPGTYDVLGYYYKVVNRFEDSEWMYLKALELKPGFRQTIRNLIDIYDEQGDYEKAMEWQQKLLRIAPEDPIPYVDMAKRAYLNKDKEKAERYFRKAVVLAGNDLYTSNVIGSFYLKHNELDLAESYANIIGDIDSSAFWYFWLKCNVYMLKNEPEKTYAILDEGISLQTTFKLKGVLTYEKALAFGHFKELDKCIEWHKKAEIIDPTIKGTAAVAQLFREKNYLALESVITELLKSHPREPVAHWVDMEVQLNLGRIEAAQKSFIKAVENGIRYGVIMNHEDFESIQQFEVYEETMRRYFPEKYDDLDTFEFSKKEGVYFFDNCITLAKYYESQKEHERANFLLQKAIELQPDTLSDNEAMVLADAYLNVGEIEKARAICPEGIESEVDTELLEAGKLLYMLNKKEAAKTQFEKYIAISNNRNARGLVSQFYRNHGEFELGEQWIKASIQHNPNYPGWRRNLARHYFFFGKKKKAFAILNEAKEIAPDDLNTLALIAILRYFENPNTAQPYFEATGKVNPNFLKLWTGLELMRNNEFKSADNAYSDLANEFNTFWFEMVEYKYLQMKIRQGKKEKAIELLNEILIKAWFVNYQLLSTDKALDPIREIEGFKKLMRRYFPEKMN